MQKHHIMHKQHKNKIRVYKHDLYKFVEVHKVLKRHEDGSIVETDFLGYARRERSTKKDEVVAPIGKAAMQTVASSAEGVVIEILE